MRNKKMTNTVATYCRIDTDCFFVYANKEIPAELKCDRVIKIGRFNVGVRGKLVPVDQQQHPPEDMKDSD